MSRPAPCVLSPFEEARNINRKTVLIMPQYSPPINSTRKTETLPGSSIDHFDREIYQLSSETSEWV